MHRILVLSHCYRAWASSFERSSFLSQRQPQVEMPTFYSIWISKMGCIWGQHANPPATEPSNAAPERSLNPKAPPPKLPVKAPPLPVHLLEEMLRDVPIEVEDLPVKAPPRHMVPPLRKPPPPKPAGVQG